MKKSAPFKVMRTRPFRVWASPFVMAAFLFSLFLCCMCGPFCGDAVAADSSVTAVAASGCCSPHTPEPVPAATDPCCPDEPGGNCCDHGIAEHALPESISTVQVNVLSAEFETVCSTALPEVRILHSLPQSTHATHGPPPYLRFQILLI